MSWWTVPIDPAGINVSHLKKKKKALEWKEKSDFVADSISEEVKHEDRDINMIPFLEVALPRKVEWICAFVVGVIKEDLFLQGFCSCFFYECKFIKEKTSKIIYFCPICHHWRVLGISVVGCKYPGEDILTCKLRIWFWLWVWYMREMKATVIAVTVKRVV